MWGGNHSHGTHAVLERSQRRKDIWHGAGRGKQFQNMLDDKLSCERGVHCHLMHIHKVNECFTVTYN